jgi:hypothetical protein
MFLDPEFVPVVGSLVLGGLLFLMAFGAMVYGWFSEEPTITKGERRPLELGALREMGRELREPARMAEERKPPEVKKAA